MKRAEFERIEQEDEESKLDIFLKTEQTMAKVWVSELGTNFPE